MNKEVVDLLKEFEDKNKNHSYYESTRHFKFNKEDINIISDLHISSGLNQSQTYSGTENFFADEAFSKYLESIQSNSFAKNVLIINGDFIDFLRIVEVPETEDDFQSWQINLSKVGIEKSIDELKKSISKKEKEFGLRTDDFKSIWKLELAIKGHPQLFNALSKWLSNGNHLFIIKGNHDLEWYWKTIRDYLRYRFAEINDSKSILETLQNNVLPNLFFIDDKMIINEEIYIEHGQRYDKFSHVVGDPVLAGKNELNIPFGSFFNRYLINRVELAYPFIDNVRPSSNILPLLMREKFFLGIKLLFLHIPFMLRIIPKRYYEYMFKKVFSFVLAISVPAAIVIYLVIENISKLDFSGEQSVFVKQLLDIGKSLAGAFISYLLARGTAYFQLQEPSRLDHPALEVLKKNPQYRIVTMGHTHNPDQICVDNRWYFNTGTWIPIIETTSAEVRHDRTYTFLKLVWDGAKYVHHALSRWDQAASHERKLIIVEKK